MTNRILCGFKFGAMIAVAVGLCLTSPTGALCASIDPLLHYTFDSADISGTTLTDYGTGGNDGTINGTVNSVAGVFGEAASFSNPSTTFDNYISSGTALLSTSSASQPYTIAFWMRANGRNGAPVGQYPGGSNRFLLTNHASFSDVGALVWWHGDSSSRAATGINVSDNARFYHVAFVKDASQNLTVYVDGVLNQAVTQKTSTLSNTDPRAFTTEHFEVGRGSSTIHGYTGLIDELFVFEQALTRGEVAALHSFNHTAPEPSTLAMLLGLGGIGLLGWMRRCRQS